MFGKCRVCAEKDKRIVSLEEQVTFLRGLVHPAVDNSFIPQANSEANEILDNTTAPPVRIESYADAVVLLSVEEAIERDQLLSGNY